MFFQKRGQIVLLVVQDHPGGVVAVLPNLFQGEALHSLV